MWFYHADGVSIRPDISLNCKPYINCYLEFPHVKHAYGPILWIIFITNNTRFYRHQKK